MKRLLLGSFALFALAGCTGLASGQGSVSGTGTATLELQPMVIPGGLLTQAIVDNYTRTSIDHLVVKVFRINGNAEQPVLNASGSQVLKDIPQAALSDTITFSQLDANTTYRIRCYAYKAPGEILAHLISTSDAGSYVDVTLTNNDRPTMATLKVRLIDTVFSGTATSSGVSVTDGGYVSSGSVIIQ